MVEYLAVGDVFPVGCLDASSVTDPGVEQPGRWFKRDMMIGMHGNGRWEGGWDAWRMQWQCRLEPSTHVGGSTSKAVELGVITVITVMRIALEKRASRESGAPYMFARHTKEAGSEGEGTSGAGGVEGVSSRQRQGKDSRLIDWASGKRGGYGSRPI